MAETEQDPSAFYEHVRGEIIEHRVVDEAEAVVAAVWIGELEELRQSALGQIAALSVAEHVARERLNTARAAGAPGDLARARARVAAVRAEHDTGVEGFRGLIAYVDVELGNAESAGRERRGRAERDLERLRAAWTDVYGDPQTPSDGG